MNYFKLLALSCILGLLTSCAAPQAKVDFDKNSKIDTSHYKKFAWLTEEKIIMASMDINPVMKVRIDDAIEAVFISKGYLLVDDAKQADFTISYSVGNREKIKVQNYPVAYCGRFNWGGSYHSGHYNDVLVVNDSHVIQYTQGKLAIDIYDVKSHQPAWHGWATKRLTSADKESPSKTIKMLIEQVLAQF